MKTVIRCVVVVVLSVAVLGVGCSAPPDPAPAPAPAPPEKPAPLPSTTAPTALAPTAEPEPAPAVIDPPAPAKPKPVPKPVATPKPPEPAPTPAPKPETVAASPLPTPAPAPVPAPSVEPEPAVVDVGGHVEIAAAKDGRSRIGVTKCKLCHKVQYTSWAESAHALRTPALDCEDCHGPGSDYKDLKIMKDPSAARAAGLVYPDRGFCETCHRTWDDTLLTRAHAHKAKTP